MNRVLPKKDVAVLTFVWLRRIECERERKMNEGNTNKNVGMQVCS